MRARVRRVGRGARPLGGVRRRPLPRGRPAARGHPHLPPPRARRPRTARRRALRLPHFARDARRRGRGRRGARENPMGGRRRRRRRAHRGRQEEQGVEPPARKAPLGLDARADAEDRPRVLDAAAVRVARDFHRGPRVHRQRCRGPVDGNGRGGAGFGPAACAVAGGERGCRGYGRVCRADASAEGSAPARGDAEAVAAEGDSDGGRCGAPA